MTEYLQPPRRRGSRIMGVGTYRPRRGVTNAEICQDIDSTEEWIETRSGIRVRGFADKDETLPAMAAAAAAKALANAGVTPDQVDCVLVATTSNLVQIPPLSTTVAHELGTGTEASFDIGAACAGFCHGVGVANDLVCMASASHVLVIGAERMTDLFEPTDRSMAFLFADGAGAVVIGPADRPGIGPTVRGADGASAEALKMTGSWDEFGANRDQPRPVMLMDGRRVFRWAADQVVEAARHALAATGMTIDQLAAFIPHQANLRIIELVVDRLGVPDHIVVATDVTTSGNTSAASVPLAMERILKEHPEVSGQPALLIGFGAGLNYAGQIVRMP